MQERKICIKVFYFPQLLSRHGRILYLNEGWLWSLRVWTFILWWSFGWCSNRMYIRVGKKESLGHWSRVILYCNKISSAKRILPSLHWGTILAKGQLARIHYDSAPRPQRSCFANPNVYLACSRLLKLLYFSLQLLRK